jgi:uncharacterized protein YndB with AHSA1/START domain
VTPVAERVVEIERRIDGTPGDVFPYFTDPDKHALWQGVRVDLDARPGGDYVVHFNDRSRIRGEYVVVDPPRKIVLTWGWESDEEFPDGSRDTPPCSTTVEISFIADGDATIIRLRHSGLPSEPAHGFTSFGWTVYLDRLSILMRGEDPGNDPSPAFLADLPRTP